MAVLEYAFLAEYIRLDPSGTWSALGAAFSNITAASLPAQQPLSIGGRVLLDDDEDVARVRFTITGPDDTFRLVTEAMTAPVQVADDAEPDEPRAVMFAAMGVIPLATAGRYTVEVQAGDGPSQTLWFRVKVADSPAAGPESPAS